MLPLLYFSSTQVASVLKAQEIIGFLSFYPFRIHTVWHGFFVTMYNYHPLRLAKSNIPKQNFSHGVNVVCDGSPSRMRRVRRISFGMTTRPRSSIRLTIPVAFILASNAFLFCPGFGCKVIVCNRRRNMQFVRAREKARKSANAKGRHTGGMPCSYFGRGQSGAYGRNGVSRASRKAFFTRVCPFRRLSARISGAQGPSAAAFPCHF